MEKIDSFDQEKTTQTCDVELYVKNEGVKYTETVSTEFSSLDLYDGIRHKFRMLRFLQPQSGIFCNKTEPKPIFARPSAYLKPNTTYVIYTTRKKRRK